MTKCKDYIQLFRIKHWIKNFLIFLPLLFSREMFVYNKVLLTFISFISFCFISSSIYIFNDIRDFNKDRVHDIKKNRPIASLRVSIKEGYILMFILLLIGLFINFLFIKDNYSFIFLIIYFLINIFYSLGFKNIPILDIIILVSGFVIRVIYGSVVGDIELSNWLYLTVMSASFFMGFGKRRNEILKNGDNSRVVLKYYTKDFLDKFLYVFLVLTIVFYSLWSIDSTTISRLNNSYMIYTIPFVIVIFMKYCLDIEGDSYGDPVDVLTSDKILMILVLLFVIVMFCLVYFL